MLINFLMYTVLFSILRITLKLQSSYIKNVAAYSILSTIIVLISNQIISFPLILVSLIIYFIIGFAIIWILDNIIDISIIWFTIIGIIAQTVVGILMSIIISAVI